MKKHVSILLLLALVGCATFAAHATDFDIRAYGAQTTAAPAANACAIQAAIDAAGKTGGRVTIPAGEWVSGTIWLRSGVELNLSEGAVLKASPNLADYNAENAYPENWGCPKDEYWRGLHFIICRACTDVAITGRGTIHGNGDAFFDEKPIRYFDWMTPTAHAWWNGIRWAKDKVNLRPGQLIVFVKCRNVRVDGITIRNSPCWSLYLYGSQEIHVRNYTVRNGPDDGNTDGIDIDCCRNVLMEDLDIETGDDAVAIRAAGRRLGLNPQPACENIVLRRAHLDASSSVFRIGVGDGLIRHVTIEDVTSTRGGTAINLNACYGNPKNGGVDMERLTFRRCRFDNCRLSYNIHAAGQKLTFGIRDVTFEDVRFAEGVPHRMSAAKGSPQPVDVRFVPAAAIATPVDVCERLLAREGHRLPKDLHVAFQLDSRLPAEGYVISGEHAVLISGERPAALVYGLGRLLREPTWRGISVPAKAHRAIYFATHFGNWYTTVSEEEIARYIEDLALWGCNAVSVWFDMHTFAGTSDSAAQRDLARLRAILRASAEVGLSCGLHLLANEGFATSEKAMRADWRAGQNGYRRSPVGHYHVEICPNAPGGLEAILASRRDVLKAFADLPITDLTVFPYDQGGCTCAACAPWGGNGYLKTMDALSPILRAAFPAAKIQLCTWRFDAFTSGEWEKLFAASERLRGMVDGLYIDPSQAGHVAKGAPAALPVIGMPEISMFSGVPWGGYGANPAPHRMNAIVLNDGQRPYSEGIFEDLNKVMILGRLWDPSRTAEVIAGDYGAFYFDPEVRGDVTRLAAALEFATAQNAVVQQGAKTCNFYQLASVDPSKPWRLIHKLPPEATTERCRETQTLAASIERRLTPAVARSWRWRLLRIRAELDALLSAGVGEEKTDRLFEELYELYRCDAHTVPCLVPPGASIWRRAGAFEAARAAGAL